MKSSRIRELLQDKAQEMLEADLMEVLVTDEYAEIFEDEVVYRMNRAIEKEFCGDDETISMLKECLDDIPDEARRKYAESIFTNEVVQDYINELFWLWIYYYSAFSSGY